MVTHPTRVAKLGDLMVRTLVDHCYVTVPRSYSTPEVLTVGDSDHQGQTISQLAKNCPYQPGTIKARSFRNFNPSRFLQDLADAKVCRQVLQDDQLEAADEVLQRELIYVANKWVPLRIRQLRKFTCPPLFP